MHTIGELNNVGLQPVTWYETSVLIQDRAQTNKVWSQPRLGLVSSSLCVEKILRVSCV